MNRRTKATGPGQSVGRRWRFLAGSSTSTMVILVLAGVALAGFLLGLVPWFVGVALLVVVAIRRRPPQGKAGRG